MKQSLFILSVFFLIIPFHLSGQDAERTPYFPYQTGDFWVNEIYHMNEYYKDEQIDVIEDSVNSEGENLYTVSSTLFHPNERIYHIKIDTSGNIHSDWWYDKGDWVKIFDSSKEVGEVWIAATTHTYELAEIIDSYTIEIFGDSTIVKEILYAANNDSSGTAQEGHGRWYVWWSEKFGIIEQRSLGFGGLEPVLKGAKIGDTVYGDTLSVSIEPDPGFSELPRSYQISNYPNPFNPVTVINYQLPVHSEVRLEVFDMLGRHVALLTNGVMEAGTHEVTFDASNLASGVYLYRLTTDNFVQTRQMVLVK